jgi:hypothetical protein
MTNIRVFERMAGGRRDTRTSRLMLIAGAFLTIWGVIMSADLDYRGTVSRVFEVVGVILVVLSILSYAYIRYSKRR